MKRRFLALLLAVVMTAGLSACGSDSSTSSDSASSESSESSETEEASETEEVSETSEESSTASTSDSSEWVIDMDDMMAGTVFEGLTADGDYEFQLIVKSFQDTYWQAVMEGVDAAAEDLGVTVVSQGPNQDSDIADQINMFNTAINNAPDGIAIAASDASAVVDSLNAAAEAGIPIVAFDTAIDTAPEGTLAATIATDDIAAGATAAQNAWEALSDRVSEIVEGGGTARFGVVTLDAVSTNHQSRGLGYINELIDLATEAGYDVAVVGNDYFVGACSDAGDESTAQVIIECAVPAQSQIDYATTEASSIMNKEDTISMYATGQTVAEALVQANNTLNVFGSDPETDMIGIGFDAGSVLIEQVSNGTLYGCITQMPYAIGYYTVCMLTAIANGDTVEDMDVPAYFYNAENMDDAHIAPNLYE